MPGQVVVLNIALNASGNLPDSTQFTLNYPTTDFLSAVVNPAAGSANKTVSCLDGAGTATCLVWGLNSSAIPNNTLASITLTLAGSPSDSSAPVQLTNAVSADSNGIPLATVASGGIVTILQPAVLSGLSCTSTTLIPAAGSTCTVTLSSAASTGGATIGISASPALVDVPASVTVPQGSTSIPFSVTANSVSSATPVTLSASYAGGNNAFGIVVEPAGPPQVTSLFPTSGTGVAQTFTMVYLDPNGLSDLTYAVVLFNNVLKSTGACAVVYSPATNKMFLLNDVGTGYSAGITLGSPAQMSNGQCTLNATGSSISTSGNSLTLKVALTFNSTFVGAKRVFLEAVGNTVKSGWIQMGTWIP